MPGGLLEAVRFNPFIVCNCSVCDWGQDSVWYCSKAIVQKSNLQSRIKEEECAGEYEIVRDGTSMSIPLLYCILSVYSEEIDFVFIIFYSPVALQHSSL